MTRHELEAVNEANEKNVKRLNRQVLLLCHVIAEINAHSKGWELCCPIPELRTMQCRKDCSTCWFQASLKDVEGADNG